MARKQILGDIGPIFGSLGEALLGSKRVKDLVQEQGQIWSALGLDFRADFGDLLTQNEHVLLVIVC